jgi:hypothetical protein
LRHAKLGINVLEPDFGGLLRDGENIRGVIEFTESES